MILILLSYIHMIVLPGIDEVVFTKPFTERGLVITSHRSILLDTIHKLVYNIIDCSVTYVLLKPSALLHRVSFFAIVSMYFLALLNDGTVMLLPLALRWC